MTSAENTFARSMCRFALPSSTFHRTALATVLTTKLNRANPTKASWACERTRQTSRKLTSLNAIYKHKVLTVALTRARTFLPVRRSETEDVTEIPQDGLAALAPRRPLEP